MNGVKIFLPLLPCITLPSHARLLARFKLYNFLPRCKFRSQSAKNGEWFTYRGSGSSPVSSENEGTAHGQKKKRRERKKEREVG